MTRQQLEHIIRAAAAIADTRDVVVIGSQAILGSFPDAPDELLVSMEADVFPKDRPADCLLIDGAMGERSIFHETFGYYAHGVDETTAVLPTGWRERLVRVENENTCGATGWCLEPHDLAVSKLVAGREKDLSFLAGLLRHRLVRPDTIRERLAHTPLDEARRKVCEARLERLLT
ncbi:MAG: DUF6036 family nucleotidyltransferase [Verrucomicrobiales bacterium]|nr:DUF6036 family nucleotidyltransferase [Verrucomicrobiales bacterium]